MAVDPQRMLKRISGTDAYLDAHMAALWCREDWPAASIEVDTVPELSGERIVTMRATVTLTNGAKATEYSTQPWEPPPSRQKGDWSPVEVAATQAVRRALIWLGYSSEMIRLKAGEDPTPAAAAQTGGGGARGGLHAVAPADGPVEMRNAGDFYTITKKRFGLNPPEVWELTKLSQETISAYQPNQLLELLSRMEIKAAERRVE